jgi:hypothetical protein
MGWLSGFVAKFKKEEEEKSLPPIYVAPPPVIKLGLELNERDSIPVELIPMDKYTALLSSSQLKNTKQIGITCPYCELGGTTDNYVAYDDVDFINHCVGSHHKSVEDVKNILFFMKYLSFKGLV